MNKMYKTNTF